MRSWIMPCLTTQWGLSEACSNTEGIVKLGIFSVFAHFGYLASTLFYRLSIHKICENIFSKSFSNIAMQRLCSQVSCVIVLIDYPSMAAGRCVRAHHAAVMFDIGCQCVQAHLCTSDTILPLQPQVLQLTNWGCVRVHASDIKLRWHESVHSPKQPLRDRSYPGTFARAIEYYRTEFDSDGNVSISFKRNQK